MSTDTSRRFIGHEISICLSPGEDTEYSTYVCVLLVGTESVPSVTLCEAETIDSLLKKLHQAGDLNPHFVAKVTFEPPPGAFQINHAMAYRRYEALSLHELWRVQTVLSGR